MFCEAWKAPFALVGPVRNKLDVWEEVGVMKRATWSQWATPLVAVPKGGCADALFCGDDNLTVNPVLITEHYPLPLPEHFFAALQGVGAFFVKDLDDSYQEVKLSEDSKSFSKVNMHKVFVD